MRHVLNTLAWGSAVIALTMAVPGCTKGDKGSEGDAATGSIKAALTVGGERHDVTAIHYKVVDESGTCSDAPLAETTSALEIEQLPGSVLPSGAGAHGGADGLFVLPPGNYRVCATPMSADGPSQECAPTEGTATVISSATTEIVLVAQCGADANGGLDVVVALNDPPKINDLDITPSKFIIACETATITAVAADPDGDAITFAWSVISSPAGASPRLQATDGVASFATDTAGDYQVRVEATDVNAGSTSLTFPVHVSALSCPAQDQCHAAGSCDLDTGACSNPSAPDGTACDDDNASTSSDTCSSGVCSGTVSSGTCSHDPCTIGSSLDATCGPCVASICQVDPFCCTSSWDAFCQGEVASVCGQTCGAPSCGDSVCDATESCSSCAADCGACAPTCPGTDLGSTVPQTVTGSTAGLTSTLTPPCAGGAAPDATFSFTAPASGTYNINTFGSAYDTVLYLNDGTCGGALLACNDDTGALQSDVTVPLTAGQTIVIVVDGYGIDSGSFTLNIASAN